MKNLKQKSFDISPNNLGEDVNKIRENYEKIDMGSYQPKVKMKSDVVKGVLNER